MTKKQQQCFIKNMSYNIESSLYTHTHCEKWIDYNEEMLRYMIKTTSTNEIQLQLMFIHTSAITQNLTTTEISLNSKLKTFSYNLMKFIL